MSSAVQAAYDLLISDAYNYAVGNQNKIHKPILHAARVVGIGAKLPLEQIGKTSQFLRDVSTGQQRPRGFTEYLRGVIYGESKLKK